MARNRCMGNYQNARMVRLGYVRDKVSVCLSLYFPLSPTLSVYLCLSLSLFSFHCLCVYKVIIMELLTGIQSERAQFLTGPSLGALSADTCQYPNYLCQNTH